MKLSKNELYEVKGGLSISSSLFSSISSLMNNIFEIGQSVGTTIRRIYSDSVCSI